MKVKALVFVSVILTSLLVSAHTFRAHTLAASQKHRAEHAQLQEREQSEDLAGNSSNEANETCTKQFCMDTYGIGDPFADLFKDPFTPDCDDDDVACFKKFVGLPNCSGDNLTCWKQAVGYPQNCSEDDYNCWLQNFGFPVCDDVDCFKESMGFNCSEENIECWKGLISSYCEWNDWDCHVKNTFAGWFCDKARGYECIKQIYGDNCAGEADEECYRKALSLPSQECEENATCLRQFYFFPTCGDDDFECWKKQSRLPDCEEDDLKCLRAALFMPNCENDAGRQMSQEDQIQCFKNYLSYPDCQEDDAACWKTTAEQAFQVFPFFLQENQAFRNHRLTTHPNTNQHKVAQRPHLAGVKQIMDHRRAAISHRAASPKKSHMRYEKRKSKRADFARLQRKNGKR